jgi:hypothetical protein
MHPLKIFLKATSQTQAEFALKVGTSKTYINHVITGFKLPGDDLIEAMIRESGGQLTYRDFRPDKADQFDRIKELEAQNA